MILKDLKTPPLQPPEVYTSNSATPYICDKRGKIVKDPEMARISRTQCDTDAILTFDSSYKGGSDECASSWYLTYRGRHSLWLTAVKSSRVGHSVQSTTDYEAVDIGRMSARHRAHRGARVIRQWSSFSVCVTCVTCVDDMIRGGWSTVKRFTWRNDRTFNFATTW